MTNTTRNLKKRLKAPRDLVEATKKGERFVPARQIDTRATHVRRFSRAIAAYACVAVVLIAGVAVLPRLLGGEPVPPTSAQSSSALPDALNPPEYVPLSEEQAANYVRPDLIWANELNPELKNNIIWAFDQANYEQTVTDPFTMPAVGGVDAQYAVVFVIGIADTESNDVSVNVLKRQAAQIDEQLVGQGFTQVEYRPSEVGSGYGFSTFYAVSRTDLAKLDTDAIMTRLSTASGDLRITLSIAWQSYEA